MSFLSVESYEEELGVFSAFGGFERNTLIIIFKNFNINYTDHHTFFRISYLFTIIDLWMGLSVIVPKKEICLGFYREEFDSWLYGMGKRSPCLL